MLNLNCLYEESPDFDEILKLREVSTFQFYPLLNKYIILLHEEGLTYEEELAFIRLNNLLKMKKDDSFFEEYLKLICLIDDETEDEIKDSISLYLTSLASDKDFDLLYKTLTDAWEDGDYSNLGLYLEIILQTSIRNDQLIKLCIEIFESIESDEYSRVVISECKHPKIEQIVENRIQYLAPFVKYLDKKHIPHATEFNELINSKLPDRDEDELSDLPDICNILSHTDQRTSNMILDAAELTFKHPKYDEEFEFRTNLSEKYLSSLPENSLGWQKSAPLEQVEEFRYYENAIITKLRGQNKLGRNDPCFCGSSLKYKKCHLLK